jgi:hypothetical protein
MTYQEAINGPDGDCWIEEVVVNEFNRMVKTKYLKLCLRRIFQLDPRSLAVCGR